MKNLINSVLELSDINAISSREEKVVSWIKDELKDLKNIKFEQDNLGSLAIIKKNKPNAPLIMMMAHLDEIGFLVTKILENGFIKFSPVGGWWGHVLLAQRVTITTKENKEIIGVIGATPPHILSDLEQKEVIAIKDMYIDIGATSKQEVLDLGISLNDMITPTSKAFVGANENILIGKAFDNRAAVAVCLEVIKKLDKIDHNANFVFVGSSQEEVGLRGAKTSTYKWTPDVAFNLDITIANDIPGLDFQVSKLGTGVALTLFDESILANYKLLRSAENICKKYKIPYTFDGWSAYSKLPDSLRKTDAGSIHLTKEGVMTMTLSIPSRYFHSHNSIVSLKDLQATVDFLVKYIKDFDSKELDKIKFK